MKRFLLGITVGAIAGALTFKKMEEKQLTDKVQKCVKQLQDAATDD